MIRKLLLACLVGVAPLVGGCFDVTPIAPSPAFEAMIAAENEADGGEDGGDSGPGTESGADGGGATGGGGGDAGAD